MNDVTKVIIPAIVGVLVGLLGSSVAWLSYFSGRRHQKRARQLDYLQTIFQYPKIPQHFSYILWNVHFLTNVGQFFHNLVVDDAGLDRIRVCKSHKHVVIGILSYVAVQSRDIVRSAQQISEKPPDIDEYLVHATLVSNRLTHPDILSAFKELLSSGDKGDQEFRRNLNEFIERERDRMCERTSYMSFLLSFACFPDFREKIVRLMDDESISEDRRWPEIKKTIEYFLHGR